MSKRTLGQDNNGHLLICQMCGETGKASEERYNS